MASDNWAQHDIQIGCIASDQIKSEVNIEFLPAVSAETAHSCASRHIPFPFSPSQISPLSGENTYANRPSYSYPNVHHLNIMNGTAEISHYPMNPALDIINISDAPITDYLTPTFPVTGMNMTSSLAFQTSDNSMIGYPCTNGATYVDSSLGALRDRNFFNFSQDQIRNFNMGRLHKKTENNSNHLIDINRSFTNFVPEIPQILDIGQRLDDNQVRVNNALQPDLANKLDGRFLSLGYQGNSCFGMQLDTCGKNASKLIASPFPSYAQPANSSFNNLEYNLSGCQNNMRGMIGGKNVGNSALPKYDLNVWQANNLGCDPSTVHVLPVIETKRHEFIPTPRSKTSGSGNEIDSVFTSKGNYTGCRDYPTTLSDMSGNRVLLSESMERGMCSPPFNSSVLRSNHQNASDQMQVLYSKPNLALPLFERTIGESELQDQSGVVLGSTTNQAVEGQGATERVKGELSHPSTTYSRESLKRRLNLSPPAPIQGQRRKILPQASSYPFSPFLLQDALEQFGKHTPSVTGCSNPFLTPAAMKGSTFSRSAKNHMAFSAPTSTIGTPTTSAGTSMHSFASVEASISPTVIPFASCASQNMSLVYPRATMSSSTSFASMSPVPVIANDGSHFTAPTISSSAMKKTAETPTNFAAIPVTFHSARRVVPETSASVTALGKTLLPRTTSVRTGPAVSSLRRSLPGLARASRPLRASSVPTPSPHIKWKGFETPQESGRKCLLCKRDLSYTPEGPVSVPPIPPAVAILPCGHTFHDHCLSLITPADQSKTPPCIPCAISDK